MFPKWEECGKRGPAVGNNPTYPKKRDMWATGGEHGGPTATRISRRNADGIWGLGNIEVSRCRRIVYAMAISRCLTDVFPQNAQRGLRETPAT